MNSERKSGVLLPIASLPGKYASGDFGKNAEVFVDYLVNAGFKMWQILPITSIGSGNSPYSGHSAFAGNYLLIDIDGIPDRLLNQQEKFDLQAPDTIYKVNYDLAKKNMKSALHIAYSRLNEDDWKNIDAFTKENADWIFDYALFQTISKLKNGIAWFDWEKELKFRDEKTIKNLACEYKNEIKYYYFEQYLFDIQWKKLRKYANDKGVEIFGDMPIYVDINSVDVWAHPEIFKLDKRLSPTRVAGVPPDYFAVDGQLWGNPLYDYKAMAKDNYAWWIRRLKRNLKFYDVLRIDHFRGFVEYWSIDAKSTTAKDGRWEKGVGMTLWDELKKSVKNPKIVAEDLGNIDDKVREYLKKTGFPGMRVIQFAFDGNKDNPHLPYNYDKNTVAYTGTHDNNTTLGWAYSLDENTKKQVLQYLNVSENGWGNGGGNCPITRGAIKAVLNSIADTVIIPLQDLAGYGGDTRLNTPGVAVGNWEIRATYQEIKETDEGYLRYLNSLYGR